MTETPVDALAANRNAKTEVRARIYGLAGPSGVVVALLCWQLLSMTHAFPKQFLPSASRVIEKLITLIITGSFWSMVEATMEAWAIGLLISIVVGVPIGIFLGSKNTVYRFVRVVIEAIRPIPPVVLIPIALLELGPTLRMSVLLVVQGALWPLLLQAFYGVRSVDSVSLDTARSFKLSWWREFVYVKTAGSLPFIVTGLRVSAAIALVVAIVAELIGGALGIGYGILKAEASDAVTTMYALIIMAGIIGIVVNGVFKQLEKRVLFWHPSFH